MSHSKSPKYKVTFKKWNIEFRIYEPMVIAEVTVKGERKESIRAGFKILADYIFGNNISKTRSESNETLPMTVPVMQQKRDMTWKVQFVMPEGHTLDTLPKPNTLSIHLISIPTKHFAVIRFSGTPTEDRLELYTKKLKTYLLDHHLLALNEPILAFYNRPSTLPFLRRNEVLIEIPFNEESDRS